MKRTSTAHVLLATAGLALALAGCSPEGGDEQAQNTSPSSATSTASQAPSSPKSEPPPSSSEAPAEPAQSRAEAEQPPHDPTYCTSGNLEVTLGQEEGAAGTVYRPLQFTNVGDVPCVLQGFPEVAYVAGDDGHQVGKSAEHNGEEGPALTLQPGEVAHSNVGFTQVLNYDESMCGPTEVRGLRVYPPKESASKYVEAPGLGCSRTDITGSHLSVTSIEKGPGGY